MSFQEPVYVTRPLLPEKEKIISRIDQIWASKQLTNGGEQHKQLQADLKEYLQVENLSLFNNGTLALLLGLKALKLQGEVITTPFTFPATVQALDWNNLTPVFCDIEPDTLTIDTDKIEALITDKTSAILAVHVFGNPCNVKKIQEIADKHNLKVIYDGAHIFGSKIDGVPVGNFGDMTMFSFHATKLFHTIEGGALSYTDTEVGSQLDLLKNFGLRNAEEVVLSGLNAKMNELQAAIGIETLKVVEEERSKRHEIKTAYEKYLKGIPGIRILTSKEGQASSYQYFVIQIDEEKFGRSRDWVHQELKNYNVFARKYFYPLCSDFSWYSHLESAKAMNLPVAQNIVKEVLSLPYFSGLDKESVIRLCDLFKDFHISSNVLTKTQG